MPLRRIPLAVAALALALAAACGRPTGVPQPSPGDQQKLPFDREPATRGLSPSQSVIPPTSHLPEGTSIAIRLREALSSASAHAGESFEGTVDEAVVVDGQALIARGATVTGRVLEAQPSGAQRPGYLRVALVSVDVAGKSAPIDTSSVFVKARSNAQGHHAGLGEVVFTPDRRLIFHLTQATDLP